MIEMDVKSLAKSILETGDVKTYSDEGELVTMVIPVKDVHNADEAGKYLKDVERDFRDSADAILKTLELSHLHAHTVKGRPRIPARR